MQNGTLFAKACLMKQNANSIKNADKLFLAAIFTSLVVFYSIVALVLG